MTDTRIRMLSPSLVAGAVRGWHIALLYGLVFCSMFVASVKISQHADADLRGSLQVLFMQTSSAVLVSIFTLVVPELRRALPDLYRRPDRDMNGTDVILFILVMVTWALGAHRLLFAYPLLHWDPTLFDRLGFIEHSSIGSGFGPVLLLLSISVVAPLAEELVFRGYLLNLWIHRWGTWPAIVLSSVLFGSGHFDAMPFATIAGVFFCLVYLRFGSLWPGTLLHGLYNLVGGPFGLSPFFLEKSRSEVLLLSHWIPEMILTAAFFPLLYLFWRRFRPQT